jgi:hypothetical protein
MTRLQLVKIGALGILLLLAIQLGYVIHGMLSPSELPAIYELTPTVKTVEIRVPVLTERVLREYIRVEDREAVDALMDENSRLKVRVNQLSIALAQATSYGGGIPKWTFSSGTACDATVRFKDYRLTFESTADRASYTLSQRFSLLHTTGKNSRGITTNLFQLYELGPDNQRQLIPITESTTFVTSPTPEGWYVKPTLQAGWGVQYQFSDRTTTRAAVFALPWLKHGKTRSTEDTRWAFLTPALIAANTTEPTFGVLPVSFNLGTVPRVPFTNVWVSPFFGTTNRQTLSQSGLFLSVTF